MSLMTEIFNAVFLIALHWNDWQQTIVFIFI